MANRVYIFLDYIGTFLRYALHIREVLGTLILLILGAGWAFSKAENIRLVDALYFAFITALSVGYGDITPKTMTGKLISICIGLMGIFFVGITAALATRSLADTAKRYEPPKK